MKWWYENEEEKMEFDKSRVFSAVNADELRAGDKVITARCMADLKTWVEADAEPNIIELIQDETNTNRFTCKCFGSNKTYDTSLAYLVERKENCTNCEEAGKKGGCRRCGEIDKILCCDCYTPKTEPKADEVCINCDYYSPYGGYCGKHDKPTRYDNTCPDFLLHEPKTGQMCLNCKHYNKVNDFRDCTLVDNPTGACPHYEAEKHYRPFANTDELIKVWCEKGGKWQKRELTMPLIWVRSKSDRKVWLITEFDKRILDYLFTNCEFLDGSPCGVEE